MKKVLSIILAVVMLTTGFAVYSSAKTTYNAVYKLSAAYNGKTYNPGETITVKPGSTVEVALSFKNDFMLGSMSTQIFYNNSIFEDAEKGDFNKDGKLYEACGRTYSVFTAWDKISKTNKEKWWPDYSASKKDEFKKNHNFCYVLMTPNSSMVDKPVRNIDEKVITITFKVSSTAKNGTTGQIVIPKEAIRRKDYLNGYTMCSVYTKDDILSDASPYVDGLTYDLSKAVLNFKVSTSSPVTLGDVNKDGDINSTDALMVLQHAVGQKALTGDAKTAADVTKDGNINSADALKILQYSVGNIKSF